MLRKKNEGRGGSGWAGYVQAGMEGPSLPRLSTHQTLGHLINVRFEDYLRP